MLSGRAELGSGRRRCATTSRMKATSRSMRSNGSPSRTSGRRSPAVHAAERSRWVTPKRALSAASDTTGGTTLTMSSTIKRRAMHSTMRSRVAGSCTSTLTTSAGHTKPPRLDFVLPGGAFNPGSMTRVGQIHSGGTPSGARRDRRGRRAERVRRLIEADGLVLGDRDHEPHDPVADEQAPQT